MARVGDGQCNNRCAKFGSKLLAAAGQAVQALPPVEFAKALDSDIVRWRTVIESARIVIE